MATAKRAKVNLEFLLVKAEMKGIPERALLKSRNIGQIDLIWPRTGVAKKLGRGSWCPSEACAILPQSLGRSALCSARRSRIIAVLPSRSPSR